MIISRRHRFIFLHNRKAAGSSITVSLARFLGDDDLQISAIPETMANGIPLSSRVISEARAQAPTYVSLARTLGGRIAARAIARSIDHAYRPLLGRKPPHAPAAALAAAFPEDWSTCRKLCVVRNPWDKTASDYFWRTKSVRNPPNFATYVRALAGGDSLGGIVPFEFHDNWPLYTIDGQIIADHVIRYDNLAEDLKSALDAMGLPWDGWLPNAKSGTRRRSKNKGDYRHLYDADMAGIVAELYKAQINAHGFKF